MKREYRLILPAILMLATLCAFGALMTGCKVLSDPTPTTQQVAAQIAVQYGTGKFIEAAKTPAAQFTRAAEVRKVAESLKAATSDESATVDTLRALALAKIRAAGLTPSDQLLANSLVDITVAELTARTKRTVVAPDGVVTTIGILSPDARVAVHKVLDWVIAAAAIYGPA